MNLANKITILRILMVPVFILFAIVELPYHMEAAVVIFLLASITDNLDGYIARKYNMITDFGKFIDPLADKLLVTGAFLVLIELGRIEAWIVFIILAREFAVTGLRTLAAAQNIIIAASSYGKIKTVTQIITIVVLLLDNFPFSSINLPMDYVMTYAALIITVISGLEYFIKNKQVIEKMK